VYRILIVDDEEIIRNGIINSIDWAKYGYEVAGEAVNGKDALEKALKEKPDIILTDIYMPVMDGIEFSHEIKKHFPEIIIIFLTGYNEFTYAQQAIEIGVFRYITKPILQNELIQTLIEASDALEHKEMEKEHLKKLKKLLKESLPLFKERFLLNLVNSVLTEQEIKNKLEYLSMDLSAQSYICVVLSIDDFTALSQSNSEADMNLMKFCIQNIAEEILTTETHMVHTFEEKRNEIIILCCVKSFDKENSILEIHQRIQQLQESVRKYLKITVSAGIGRFYSNLSDIGKSYNEAKSALEYRMAFGKNSIILIEDMEQNPGAVVPPVAIQKIDDLILYTKGGNKAQTLHVLNEIFDYIRTEGALKKDYISMLAIEIVNRLIRVILEFGDNLSDVLGEQFSPFQVIGYDTLEDIYNEISAATEKIINYVQSKHNAVTRNSIEKAKEFIHQNYMNSELNLKTVAESVHISPGYFSQLFRQVTGKNCIEYLTKVRIDAAKKLLKETTLKTYEIAEKVGFNDSQYFSTCFKKLIGVTPTEYRDVIRDDFISL